MENTFTDILLTLLSILCFAWVVIRLAVTVVPLQIREARVVNGLAKLRKQLLISGVSIMAVALVGFAILTLSLAYPTYSLLLEPLIFLMVALLIVVAETKHAIYHQQYTPEHKALSRKIQHELDTQEGTPPVAKP
jgi:hypothetical protein